MATTDGTTGAPDASDTGTRAGTATGATADGSSAATPAAVAAPATNDTHDTSAGASNTMATDVAPAPVAARSTAAPAAASANPALAAYAAKLGASGPAIIAAYGDKPLPFLVGAVLARLTDQGEDFTAYDVTMILRALFVTTQRALPHYDQQGLPGVQPEVHRRMVGYVRSGVYGERVGYPNEVQPARIYHPMRRGRRRGKGRSGKSQTGVGLLPAGAWVVKNDGGS